MTDLIQPAPRQGIFTSLLNANKWLLFLLWLLLSFVVVYLNMKVLYTDEIYYNTYGERVAMERITRYLEMKASFWWLSYAFVPIVLLVKFSLITLSLNVGTLLADVKISFGKLWGIVLSLEGIFILASIIRVFWIRAVTGADVMEDIRYFYPFSVLNFFDASTLPSWMIYPVQLMNLFEVAFILLLALGIQYRTGLQYGKSLVLVLASYGVGLVIWAMLIILLTISLT